MLKYQTRETRMCTPKCTPCNFIKEKKNHEYTFKNINGEKQKWAQQIAHFTISIKKRKPMNTCFSWTVQTIPCSSCPGQTIPCSSCPGQTIRCSSLSDNTPVVTHVTAPNSGKVRQVGLVEDTLLQLVLPDNILLQRVLEISICTTKIIEEQ